MYQTILVPLDGSPFSQHALPLAGRIAQRTGASLTLVHVHQPYIRSFVNGASLTAYELDAELRAAEHTQLETMRTRLSQDVMSDIRATFLDGSVVNMLTEYITTTRPNLVVMTTHGRKGLARVWLGSVADGLIRHINVPTLLVRPHLEEQQPSPTQLFTHIIVPLDGSLLAESILQPALALGNLSQAEYTLVAVVEPFLLFDAVSLRLEPSPEHEQTRLRMTQAQAYLGGVRARLQAAGKIVRTSVCVNEHPAHAILNEAHRLRADLIAMATHGRSGWQRLRLGSVADKVLRGAHSPVLLLRPSEETTL